MRRAFLTAVLLIAANTTRAQELSPADIVLAGMQLGKSTLQDVLTRFGIAPLRHGDVDELCYRSESPLVSYWVLFGAGDEGDYEKLTQFRVVTIQPPDITCPPSARLTPDLSTDGGVHLGMPAEELKPKLGPRLRITVDNGSVTSYVVKLQQ
jgi:hypothetical protein